MNIYTENGLHGVINASGRMTKLGVSTVSEEVGKTLVEAAGNYVVIDELLECCLLYTSIRDEAE